MCVCVCVCVHGCVCVSVYCLCIVLRMDVMDVSMYTHSNAYRIHIKRAEDLWPHFFNVSESKHVSHLAPIVFNLAR